MRVTNVFIFLILLIAAACDTESSFTIPEENYFVKFYGEEGEQEGIDFVLNSDGSVVMVGNTWTREDKSDQQIYVVKVDANGHVIWQRKIGLSGKRDIAKDVELHSDGRIVVAGETEMSTNNRDVYIKTLSQDGNELDSARHGLKNGSIDSDEEVYSVSIVNGGGIFLPGFIVTGSTTLVNSLDATDLHDAMAIRFNNTLNRIEETGVDPLWTASRYGFNGDDVAVKAIEISSDTIYFFGYSNTITGTYTGDYNYWYYSLSGDGGTLDANYFGKPTEDERLDAVEVTFTNVGVRYILSGFSTGVGNSAQSFVAGLQPRLVFKNGDIKRERNPTDLGSYTGKQFKVKVKGSFNDSFILISSNTQSPNQFSNIAFSRLKSDLTKSFEPLIFASEGDDFAGSVSELPDGKILLMGTMTIGQSTTPGQKKMVLIKLNPNGKLSE